MAMVIKPYRVDDLETSRDPRDEVVADETVKFAVNGEEYEIDLTAGNAQTFLDMLRPYKDAGRRVKRTRKNRPASQRERTAEIRAKAKEMGLDVERFGRLSEDVIARVLQAEDQAEA
jgi:hypothetical protein